MYLTLAFKFEAVTTLMSGIIGFPVTPGLYNSFDTLFVCFNGLTNKWKQDIFQTWFFSKLEFVRISFIRYPRTGCFQVHFTSLLVGHVTLFCITRFTFNKWESFGVFYWQEYNFLHEMHLILLTTKKSDSVQAMKLHRKQVS